MDNTVKQVANFSNVFSAENIIRDICEAEHIQSPVVETDTIIFFGLFIIVKIFLLYIFFKFVLNPILMKLLDYFGITQNFTPLMWFYFYICSVYIIATSFKNYRWFSIIATIVGNGSEDNSEDSDDGDKVLTVILIK